AGHRRKSGHGVPTLGHERNDRDGGDEGPGRAERAEDAETLVPVAGEEQRAKGPFRDAEEPARALVAEHGIEPPDQRAVADEGREPRRLIGPPLLVTEEEEHDHHRGTDDVSVEIAGEQAGAAERASERIERGVDERCHGRIPSRCRIDAAAHYATAGKSIAVSLMRLKTLVKAVVAKARLMSTSCASL